MCGTCTVLVDNLARRSCTMTLGDVSGKAVLTIEGLATPAGLHPLQQAFVDEGALQCGFCTPGMILRALALLREMPNPTEDDVVRAMDRNLCRCGAHPRIVRAILNSANPDGIPPMKKTKFTLRRVRAAAAEPPGRPKNHGRGYRRVFVCAFDRGCGGTPQRLLTD